MELCLLLKRSRIAQSQFTIALLFIRCFYKPKTHTHTYIQTHCTTEAKISQDKIPDTKKHVINNILHKYIFKTKGPKRRSS